MHSIKHGVSYTAELAKNKYLYQHSRHLPVPHCFEHEPACVFHIYTGVLEPLLGV